MLQIFCDGPYCPNDTEILFEQGLLLQQSGNLSAAEACFLQLLDSSPEEHFASVDPGLRGYRSRHQLALIYDQQGRSHDAEQQWRAVLAERPDFRPALFGLAEGCLEQRRWQEFDELVKRMETSFESDMEATVLRARRHMAERDFNIARALLEHACERYPAAVWPRIILSHALLQENKDPIAAERALREVLKLDPDHEATRHNLRVLLAETRPSRTSP